MGRIKMGQINDYIANFMLSNVHNNQMGNPTSMKTGQSTNFQALLMQKIAMAQQMNPFINQPNASLSNDFSFPMMMGQQAQPLQMGSPYDDMIQAYSRNTATNSLVPTQTDTSNSVLRKQPPTEAYNGLIKQAANKYGVDENLIHAIIKMESNYNPNTESHAGAVGLMQLMPVTAKAVGVTDRWDIAQNIDGGTHYFSNMLRDQGGDIRMALAAYNAGPGNVKKYGGVPPFKETQNYIKKVMDYYTV